MKEIQTSTNNSKTAPVYRIKISEKMTKLALTAILKIWYNHLRGGTNENKGGTNGYKRCSVEPRKLHFDILKNGGDTVIA